MGCRLVLVRVEESNEFVLDGFGGCSRDLLAADTRDEGAEGVDCFCQTEGGEDGAGVLSDHGGEAGVCRD